eukprot:358287-Chlamydomonas_euryale.AAC.1
MRNTLPSDAAVALHELVESGFAQDALVDADPVDGKAPMQRSVRRTVKQCVSTNFGKQGLSELKTAWSVGESLKYSSVAKRA